MNTASLRRTALRQAVEPWAGLSDHTWEAFAGLFQPRTLGPRELLVVTSQQAQVYFVARGLIRFYYQDEAIEVNQLFASEGDLVRAVTAELLEKPYGAEALEESEVLIASSSALDDLAQHDPTIERVLRGLAETMLTRKDRRLWALQCLAAGPRYADFLQRFPHLVGRVPQFHIANYLGMTEVSLSRLKRRLT